jgi:hypothetical protein
MVVGATPSAENAGSLRSSGFHNVAVDYKMAPLKKDSGTYVVCAIVQGANLFPMNMDEDPGKK